MNTEEAVKQAELVSEQLFIKAIFCPPSCKKVRSFLTTGNSGMMGGCMLWLLRMLRYLAMFLEGSNTSCRSPNSFSYLLGNFSHELRRRATGAKFRPLRRGADKEDEKEQVETRRRTQQNQPEMK